jgi:hypothetical protein
VAEPVLHEAQEATLLGAVEQNLGDGQAENLRVPYPRLGTRPGRISLGKEIVCQHVKCNQKVVEVGEHVTTSVWSELLEHTGLRRPFLRPYSPAQARRE